MGTLNWERWARAGGVAFVVLAAAAFTVGGEAPKVGDSPDDLISYYDGDRGKVLVSSLLFAFGLLFFLWFAAAIANLLRESGEGRVGATVIAAATAFVALQLALTGMAASLAYSIAGGGDPGVVKALFDLQWVFDMFAALPAAVFVLLSSARYGFWSPTGEYLFILIPVAMLWILVTSIILVRVARPSATALEVRSTSSA